MRVGRTWVLGLAPVLMATAPAPSTPSQRFAALLDAYWEALLQRNPIQATAIGDDRYNDRFPNTLSPTFRKEERAFLDRWLRKVRAVDPGPLTPPERLSLQVLRRGLEKDLAGLRYPEHLLPLNQSGGVPTLFAQLASGEGMQPFRTVKDYEAFLRRMEGLLAWLHQAQVNLAEGVKRGVVQPRPVIEKVIPQLEALAAGPAERSVFWGSVKRMPATISEADRGRLTAAYRAKIEGQVLPAFRRLATFLRQDYLPHGRPTVGWSALPDGKAWYAHRVRVMTTTNLDPETIHQLGLKEVARILGEMEAVKRQVGFPGDLPAFFQHLNEDPRHYFTQGADLVKGYGDLQVRINALLPRLFDIAPKADCVVREVEPFRAQGAAGASYEAGTPDGRRPGIFYVNTFDLKAQPKFGMETLSLHEASPGHHFQISIAQEVESLPKFRRFSEVNAYAEGWALYAESLGKELGLFTDPYQWYGRLSDEQLRAMRLVVDTGLHAKGWTREQAIRFMRENSSMAESDVVSEVERYIVWPGQALGYKLGQFAIRDLRTEAEQALGSRFDVKAFHRQVLVDGALPLDVLQAKVRAWIAAEKAKG